MSFIILTFTFLKKEITNIPISELKTLANSLKKKLSVGGSVKNDEILLQGNLREKVLKFLINNNFNAKPSGG